MNNIHNTKALTIFLLLTLFCFSSRAQQVYSSNPSSKISFMEGITFSNVFNDTINYSSGILFNAGFVYSLRLSEKLNTNIELLYTGKAVKSDAPIVKYRFFYVDIPLYLQYNFNENFRFNIGGQYSIFTNSIISVIDGNNSNGVNNIKFKALRNTDYGFLAGLELDVTEKITITSRYTISGSAFFDNKMPAFGVINIGFRHLFHSSYKQIFNKKDAPQ